MTRPAHDREAMARAEAYVTVAREAVALAVGAVWDTDVVTVRAALHRADEALHEALRGLDQAATK